ncbi:hypothetical protein EG833_04565, partial [archaeon]|nr:hypothetical protein [archaeon]
MSWDCCSVCPLSSWVSSPTHATSTFSQEESKMEHGFMVLNFINEHLYKFFHEAFGLIFPGDLPKFFTDGNHFIQVTYTWFYMLVLILMGFLVVRALKLVPGRMQNFLEVLIGGLKGLLVDTMGEKGLIFFPLMATIFLYILTCNLGGIIPGFYSPTANLNTNLSMALS